jgi:HD-GYP domain-containing protein (c-di-GMP phosphodiesterase class II)
VARRTTKIRNERRAKFVIATLYALGGLVVVAWLVTRESFPPIGLWLAFAAAFAFFDWRSVEVNDRLLLSPTIMVGLTAAVAFGPGHAALGVATMAALGAVSARDVKERRLFQPVANFGQLVVTSAAMGLVLEFFLKHAEAGGTGAFWLWLAAGSAAAALVNAAVNFAMVIIAVRTVFGQDLRMWSHMNELLPSYLGMGFIGGLLGATLLQARVVLPLVFVVFIIGYHAFASFGQLREAHAATLRGFVKALEAKDLYTRGHTERVAEFSVLCAQHMGFTGTRLERIEWAALIHDVGKLAVPRDLIRKPGKLSSEEYSELQRHAHAVEDILAEVEFLRPMVEIASAHHSNYDGSGYGGVGHIEGEEPSLEASILAVADAFDAMTSTRSYRMALSQSYAFTELRRNAGKQFHPEVVEHFIAAIGETKRRYGSPFLNDPEEARRMAEGRVESRG